MTVEKDSLSPAVRWALAIGCAIPVGNIWYLQPLLASVAREFRVSESGAGLASTLTQVGYAAGMLMIVPLGDVRERRGLVMTMLGLSAAVALAVAAAPTFPLLCGLSLLLGFVSCTAQLLIPFAADLAPERERGRVLGFVVSGLLLGILLARTVSGFVGGHFGWRSVYVLAAVLAVGLAVYLRALLPKSVPQARVAYGRLMASLVELVREEPVLRESAVYGATLFASFSAFWTTLAFLLEPRGLGPEVVGLFGLIGAAGALAAPLAGRLADRSGPERTILLGAATVLVSFAIMLQASLFALVLGVLLMDVGVQAAHVSNQSRFYARRPESRSRMNTVYMTCYFVGGSVGSALGAWAWGAYRWPGVCAVGAGFALVALAVFGLARRPSGAAVRG